MKFFYKLLLSMLLLVTVALSVVEYFTVASGLDHSFQRTLDGCMTEHMLICHAVQSAMFSTDQTRITDEEMAAIEDNASQLQRSGGTLYLSCKDAEKSTDPSDGTSTYQVRSGKNDRLTLVAQSKFSQQQRDVTLTTEQDISSVFAETDEIQKQYMRLYFVVLGCCVLASLLLSYALTRHLANLRKTTKALAKGRYDVRSTVRSRDEIGELARTYNEMADTIQSKIGELEETNERRKRFVASFAHELKTPMTSIIGYADTIYQKNLTPDQIRQAAWYIVNEGMRLESLSFKLMDLQSLDEGHFMLEQTEITTILRDAAAAVLPTAQKRGIAFKCRVEPGWVRLEYDLFKTLLLNLLDNAMKSGTDQILLLGENTEEYYQISVADHGRGIPPEDLERITEAFYMVDKSRSRKEHGAGLGLALCVRIAELHGTKLHYDSTPEKGTTVSMRLKKEVISDEEDG